MVTLDPNTAGFGDGVVNNETTVSDDNSFRLGGLLLGILDERGKECALRCHPQHKEDGFRVCVYE